MDRGKPSPILAPRHDSASRVGKPEPAADKLAALKARVAAAVGNSKAKAGTSSSAGLGMGMGMGGNNIAPVTAKGGLNVDLHPALQNMDQYKPSKRESVASKFATNIGNARSQPEKAVPKKQLDLSGPSAEETRRAMPPLP